MKKLLILLSLLLVFPFAFAGNTELSHDDGVVPINMKLTGLIRHVDDFGRSFFDVELKGNPGMATGRGVAVSGPPVMYGDLPAGNPCVDFSPGPSGLHLMEAQMVLIFRDSSMIWANSPPGGYVCFSGFAYAPYDIMGGSGRFEGATGWVAFEIDTYGFPPHLPRLVTPETGIGTGEIILP
jgi:hypothetical protein